MINTDMFVPKHRMLTILKLCQVTVAVVILITAAGHTGIRNTDHHSRYFFALFCGCLFFFADIETGLGPGSKGELTAKITEAKIRK